MGELEHFLAELRLIAHILFPRCKNEAELCALHAKFKLIFKELNRALWKR